MITLLAILIMAAQPEQAPHNDQDQYWSHQDLKPLESAARRGDKHAQFELGKRFELGTGVPTSLSEAERWYQRAARTTTNRHFVYSGPVGSEKHGRAIELGSPEIIVGLPAAAARLEALRHGRKGKDQ